MNKQTGLERLYKPELREQVFETVSVVVCQKYTWEGGQEHQLTDLQREQL